MGVPLPKVAYEPPEGKKGPASHQSTEVSPLEASDGILKHLVAGEICPISPLFYTDLGIGKALVRALIDSGASANFIFVREASELQLRRHKLHSGQTFTVAN